MSITQILDDLRASIPGCTIIAFGDLKAHQVFLSSTQRSRPQEHLDELCNQAATCFKVADTDLTALSPGFGAGDQTHEAILMTPTETRVFVRSATEDTDVLCCVCKGLGEARPLAKAAHMAMRQLSEKL